MSEDNRVLKMFPLVVAFVCLVSNVLGGTEEQRIKLEQGLLAFFREPR